MGTGNVHEGAVLAWGHGAGEFSLDFRRDEVDLLAVFVRNNRIVSGPRIRPQDDPVLGRGEKRPLAQCPPDPWPLL